MFVLKHNKYYQIDPRDKIVLWIELEDDCNKLAIDRHRQVLSTQLTDNGPVYYVMQTKLITLLICSATLSAVILRDLVQILSTASRNA